MAFDCITVRREGTIEHVVLNRPAVRNAFNEHAIRELTWWADSAAKDRTLRLAILSGAGPCLLCGRRRHVDVPHARVHAAGEHRGRDARWAACSCRSTGCRFRSIGRVHGAALGGGAGLCAVCDIVVAADDAVFGFTEVKLGIIPAVISPFVLVKIGRSAARELFLTGARFSAARACRIGLVHAVVACCGTGRESSGVRVRAADVGVRKPSARSRRSSRRLRGAGPERRRP